MPQPPLRRPRRVVVGGVCAALAAHLGARVGTVRFVFVVGAVLGGGTLLLYLWLWALVPMAPSAPGEEAGARRSAPVAVLGAAAAVLAALVVVATAGTPDDSAVSRGLVATMLGAVVAVAWSLAFDRRDPLRSARSGVIVRGTSSAALVVAGAVALLGRPSALNAVAAVGVVVLGVGVLAAPRVVALWSDLMQERAARVREEQRAEIAAHLHDSVLQTLALIQNRAGASSEVARIARAQERELRDWLFERDVPLVNDLAGELRSIAAAVELDHPVHIDVVATGQSVPGVPAVLAAAREAMLNAARHAGGDVSVYVETIGGAIDVFVRDRGPGVDLAALGADRLGIRESIIGRMSRAGGRATVRPGAGGAGTEVYLHLEETA